MILSIAHWGDKHYAGKMGPPVRHRHRSCGHDFTSVLACSGCGHHIVARKRPRRRGTPEVTRGPIRER